VSPTKLAELVPHKFLDGPLAGRTIDLPRGTETFLIGPRCSPLFTYEYAGKDGITVLLAKRGRSRQLRRLVLDYIGKKGKHPALVALGWRRHPTVGKTVKTGKGAAARAAKKAVRD
jgi:hypothetical protein